MQEASSYYPLPAPFSYTFGMDEVRELIRRRAKEVGTSLAKLSKDIGRNATYLQQFITKGSPERLGEDDRTRLAQLLRVDEIELGARSDRSKAQNAARIAGPIQLGTVIPAYGHAVGGRDGQFILNGNKIADLLAPPTLAGVRDAYAVYVPGDSMEPRYHAGEVVFVNPRLPVRRDDYVVAQIAADDGSAPEAYVKRFVGKTEHQVRLEQYNPKKVIEFRLKRLVSLHRIVMGGDG